MNQTFEHYNAYAQKNLYIGTFGYIDAIEFVRMSVSSTVYASTVTIALNVYF